MSKHELLRQLRDANVIIHEPVTLRGGEVSSYYVDIKKAYGNPEILRRMAQMTLEYVDSEITCIAASGYGGIPLGAAVSLAADLPLVSVRDTPKNHGRGGLIDGYVPNESDNILIVDDVFTSGSSMRQTLGNLAATRVNICGGHVVVARGDVRKFELPVSYLLGPEDIAR